MASIEKKIIAAILKLARNQEENRASPETDFRNHSSATAPAARLRDAQFSDFGAVAELKRRWGLAPDSPENWERLWRSNPALMNAQAARPIGWVLESEGRLVGYLGNISQTYYFGGKSLTAATGSGLVVDPAYRAISLSLIAAYYRQKSVDLFLTTTAIETVGKIACAFRSDPLPQADYETVLFWVLRSHPFARAVMKRLRLNALLSYACGLLASPAIGIDRMVRRRSPRSCSKDFRISEISVAEVGDDFQALWTKKLSERPRLLADRSPATLRWHFTIPGDGATTRVLCCHLNGKLRGYAIIRSDVSERNGLKRSMISDIIALQDDPEVLRVLFAAAYEHAKRTGSEILEVLGLPPEVRQVLFESNPYLRKYPACPFYYKAADPIFHKTLADPSSWYATPFDGDTTLVPSLPQDVSSRESGSVHFKDTDSRAISTVHERERAGVI
jgi:hypothetical protein